MGAETVITSKDNPMIRHYRRLCGHRRFRRMQEEFPAEGLRLVREAIRSGTNGAVMITESAWEKYGSEFIGAVRISDEVGRYIAETEHPQGVFTTCRMPRLRMGTEPLDPEGRYLVLYQIQDPGNLGMILRTADALGIDAVLTCRCCDMFSPKVIRATMGAVFRLRMLEFPDAASVSERLRESEIRSFAAILHKEARPVTKVKLGKGCAVWIGNEGSGLTDDAVSVCEEKVIIPMQGNAESLNAAMAAGILIWEMMKAEERKHG